MTKPQIEPHGRAFFAEVAEALGVPTNEILAVMPRGQLGMLAVLFTPDGGTAVYSILLRRRSGSGILQRFTKPAYVTSVSALFEQLALDEDDDGDH